MSPVHGVSAPLPCTAAPSGVLPRAAHRRDRMARALAIVFKDPACTARLIATWRTPPSTAKTDSVVARCVSRFQKSSCVCMRTHPCMRNSVKRAITLAHVTHACDQGRGYMTRGLGSGRWFCCLSWCHLFFHPAPSPLPHPPSHPSSLRPSLTLSFSPCVCLPSIPPPILSLMQGCKNRASFGRHRAEWCSLHRAPHTTNQRLSSCTFAGCLKQASFQNTYICMRVCMCELGAVHAT